MASQAWQIIARFSGQTEGKSEREKKEKFFKVILQNILTQDRKKDLHLRTFTAVVFCFLF